MRITRIAPLCALAVALAGALSGSAARAADQQITLDNGLRVFAAQRSRADVAGWHLAFRYPALSAEAEKPSLRGLTQQVLLDALLARLNTGPAYGALREGRDGGESLAISTEWEYVEARGKVVSGDVGAALKLLADALTTVKPTVKDLDAARARLIAASDANAADIGEATFYLFRQALEGDRAPTGPVYGGAAELKTLTPEDVAGALARYYVASNACLTIVAPQPPEETLRLARGVLSGLPKRPAPSLPALPPRPLASDLQVGDIAGADRASLMVGVGLPPADSPDFWIGEVIAAALGGTGGRFERDASLYTILGIPKTAHPLPDGAVLMLPVPFSMRPYIVVHAVADPMSIDDATPAISHQILSLAEVAMPEAELRRAKGRVIGEWALDGDRAVSLASRLNLYQVFGLDPRLDVRLPERVKAVTAEQIMRFAGKYFTRVATAVRMPD